MARYRTVELKKGDLVHDVISGFAGTVVTKINRLHGTVEWVVESERTPMMPSQSHPYTEKEILRLKVIGNVLEDQDKLPVPLIKLGDVVQDRISKFAGTVAHKIDRLYDTVEWLVESEATPQMPSEVRIYGEKELPRLVVVASAFDQERPILARPKPPRGPKKAHKRR